MSSYYAHSDEDELDIRIHRGRSPSHGHVHMPVVYPEHRYRPAPRPYYAGESSYLVPAVSSGGGLNRSRSTGHRPSPPPAPAQPIVINNRIYNDYEDDDYMALQPPRRMSSHGRRRSGSRSRPSSYMESDRERERDRVIVRRDPRDEYELDKARRDLEAYKLAHTRDEYEMEKSRRDLEAYKMAHSRDEYEIERKRRELDEYRRLHEREDYELEKARKELEKQKIGSAKEEYELEKAKRELKKYKDAKDKEDEEKRIKKELELERLIKEKKADDEKKRLKKEADAAIEKYKIEEAEKAAKAKKEKEENEKDYQKRLEDDLRKSGMDERQIAVVLKKDKGVDPNRPTYTRMSRRHLSIETLNRYRVDYEFDQDPDYVLIKRWVPEYEQDFLWSHTREIRERRRSEVVLSIEGKKKPHHHHTDLTEFELVKKTKHVRKPSPSPLLTFLAGGRR